MKKSFVFFSAQYLPTAGGVERYTNSLARRLTALGNSVTVVTSALPGLAEHEVDGDGIEIFRFPSYLLMNGRLPVLRFGKAFRRMEQTLWSRKFDHCVINTYFYPLSMYAASRCRREGIPSLIINHGSAWLMTGSAPVRLAGQIYERLAVRVCRRYCKRFFGVSEAARQWMDTFSVPTEGIITNAIDPDDVVAKIAPDVCWRQALGLPEEAKVIAFVGRMFPEKGVDQMIGAMSAIRRVHPDACLLMAGGGPLYEKYREEAPEGVYLLGGQPYGAVLALLKQADIFCLPSRSEGFACTVLEAAAAGCPIITTATGGSPQLLMDERHGILLESMEPEAVSAACIRALDDPEWRLTAAGLTEKRLRENYTWDAAVRQLLQAVES